MKKMIFLLIVFSISGTVYAQHIFLESYIEILQAVESYINNEPVKSDAIIIIYDCERNENYHSGYKKADIFYLINTYPYTKMSAGYPKNTKYVVYISIDEQKESIIINMEIDNKWYGFYKKLIIENGRIFLESYPEGLYEND